MTPARATPKPGSRSAREIAAVYVSWIRGELLARLHRGPSPAEIYAAYNIGLRGFARRGFRLDRCPRVTRDRAAVVAAGVSRRMWALDNAELDRRFNELVAEGERLRIRKGGAR